MTFEQGTSAIPASWFVDPSDTRRLRWWDGEAWTEHTRAPESATVTPASPAARAEDWSRWQGEVTPYVPERPVEEFSVEPETGSGPHRPRLFLAIGAAVIAVGAAASILPRVVDPIEDTAALPLVSSSDDVASVEDMDVDVEVSPEALVAWISSDLADQGVTADGILCTPPPSWDVGTTIACSALLDDAALSLVVQVVDDGTGTPFAIVQQSISATVSS